MTDDLIGLLQTEDICPAPAGARYEQPAGLNHAEAAADPGCKTEDIRHATAGVRCLERADHSGQWAKTFRNGLIENFAIRKRA